MTSKQNLEFQKYQAKKKAKQNGVAQYYYAYPSGAPEFTPGFSGLVLLDVQLYALQIVVCLFSFGHCVVCPSSNYEFRLPLWYLQTCITQSVSGANTVYMRSVNSTLGESKPVSFSIMLLLLKQRFSTREQMTLADCGSPVKVFWFSYSQRLLNYLVSNLLTLRIPDKSYSRNASCALNIISTFLFQ